MLMMLTPSPPNRANTTTTTPRILTPIATQRLLSGQMLRPQSPARIIFEVEIGAGAAVEERHLIAAAIGNDFVLDQSDRHAQS
jgi:hypothetical protein